MREDRILEALGCCENRQPFCVYVAGAGGKTSWIHYLAKREKRQGKRVLILTSTHMYEPEGVGCIRGEEAETPKERRRWAEEIGDRLMHQRLVIAGKRCGEGKIAWIGDDVYGMVRRRADVILIEADGSRHLPVKVPSHREPVIFSDADLIFVTEGMNAVGKPLREVCHRVERAGELLRCREEDLVTEEMVRRMYREGYAVGLKRSHPGVPVVPVWIWQGEAGEQWEWERDGEGNIVGIVWRRGENRSF